MAPTLNETFMACYVNSASLSCQDLLVQVKTDAGTFKVNTHYDTHRKHPGMHASKCKIIHMHIYLYLYLYICIHIYKHI